MSDKYRLIQQGMIVGKEGPGHRRISWLANLRKWTGKHQLKNSMYETKNYIFFLKENMCQINFDRCQFSLLHNNRELYFSRTLNIRPWKLVIERMKMLKAQKMPLDFHSRTLYKSSSENAFLYFIWYEIKTILITIILCHVWLYWL